SLAVPTDPTSRGTDPASPPGKRPRSRPADRATSNGKRGRGQARSAEHSKAADSKDDEALAPDIAEAVGRVEKLDNDGLLRAARPAMSGKQLKRLAGLNRKAQDDGLSAAEERERDELLHAYEKAMVVRATALAELRKRGVDISDLIAAP